ncbi:hypothetical protein [Epilithonimonas hominis]|uniref:hypothetical protein n=1 Tax=Epilithonimonas hominis TaxID=420404 RepID=UPI00289E5C84|nr:hypothetical protein [Epilithonimonas hominis]
MKNFEGTRNLVKETAKADDYHNKSFQKKIKGVQKTNKKIKIGMQIENSIELQKKQAISFENAQIQIPPSLRKTINNENAQKYIKSKIRKKEREMKREVRNTHNLLIKNCEEQLLFERQKKYDFEIIFCKGYSHYDLKIGMKILTEKFGEVKIIDLYNSKTHNEWISLELETAQTKKILLKNLSLCMISDSMQESPIT